jgi:hypothetical protein
MKLNWLKLFKPEDPLRLVANVRQQNRIANILNDIQGVNCRIIKPTNADGKGWMIVVDGSSDLKPEPGSEPYWPDPFSGNCDSLNQMYKIVQAAGGDSFTIRPGIWDRCDAINASSHKHDDVFNPASMGIISSGYTGSVYVHCLLLNSTGMDGAVGDFSNESDFYNHNNDGTNGLVIFLSINPISDGSANPFSQWLLLGEVKFESGVISEVIQYHMGPYKDAVGVYSNWRKTGGGYESGEAFQPCCIYTPGTTSATYSIYISEGKWIVRNQLYVVPELVQAAPAAAKYIYAQAVMDAADPSLVPDSVALLSEDAFAEDPGYQFRKQLLYTLINKQVVCTSNDDKVDVPYLVTHHAGEIKHDWVRPDGRDTETWAAEIDNVYPRVRSHNFVSNDPVPTQEGALQDYNAAETILEAPYVDEDHAISYFKVKLSGEPTDKKYAYLDKKGNELGKVNCGKSIEIDPTLEFLQLYGFFTPIAEQIGQIESWSEFYGAEDPDTGLALVVRDPAGAGGKTLRYMSLYDFTAAHADDCRDIVLDENFCTKFQNWLDYCEDLTIQHDHEDHVFNTDDHDGQPNEGGYGVQDRYVEVQQGPTRNNFQENSGLGDYVGALSIDVNARRLYDIGGTDTVLNWDEGGCWDGADEVFNWIGAGAKGRYFDLSASAYLREKDYPSDNPTLRLNAYNWWSEDVLEMLLNYASKIIASQSFQLSAPVDNMTWRSALGLEVTDWTEMGALIQGKNIAPYRIRVLNADTLLEQDIEVLGRPV